MAELCSKPDNEFDQGVQQSIFFVADILAVDPFEMSGVRRQLAKSITSSSFRALTLYDNPLGLGWFSNLNPVFTLIIPVATPLLVLFFRFCQPAFDPRVHFRFAVIPDYRRYTDRDSVRAHERQVAKSFAVTYSP